MASERRSKTREAHHAATTPDGEAPWADLEVTVPTDRDHASVVALVECALVELMHEAVGAVFVSQQVGRSTWTQYVAGFLVVSALMMHDFWAVDEDQQQDEMTGFLKNVVMAGGALAIAALTTQSWAFSLGIGL